MIARFAPAVLLMACGASRPTSAPSPKHVATSESSNATPTPIDAIPMLGPFANEGEVCARLVAACPSTNGCTCATDVVVVANAMLFVTKDRAVPGRAVTHVALQKPAGWFVALDGPESSLDPQKKEHTVVTSRGARTEAMLVGAQSQIAFDFVEVTIGPTGQTERASVVLCAVGAVSSVPSCFDPIRAAPTSDAPKPVKIAVDSTGIWRAERSTGLTMLVAAGNFTTHQELPLEGPYLLRLP